jgi:hypothetical protein
MTKITVSIEREIVTEVTIRSNTTARELASCVADIEEPEVRFKGAEVPPNAVLGELIGEEDLVRVVDGSRRKPEFRVP